jgi:hypothetical protein
MHTSTNLEQAGDIRYTKCMLVEDIPQLGVWRTDHVREPPVNKLNRVACAELAPLGVEPWTAHQRGWPDVLNRRS